MMTMAFIKSQGLGSGERSLAQPECVALNDAWGDGRCVCERKFNGHPLLADERLDAQKCRATAPFLESRDLNLGGRWP